MIIDTKQHADMKRTLKVILVWCTFEGGTELNPVHVEKLCRKALRKEVIKK